MNDNVRKIFEMLGVEPNEKFKIKGRDNDLYCLTEGLLGYVFDKKRKSHESIIEWLLRYLLINPETIIKLPKESKKKKLRDITLEEYKKWLNKNCKNTSCDSCNFNNVACNMGIRSWVNNKDIYSDKFLDQEIEVEE